jgi:hypothetical protein
MKTHSGEKKSANSRPSSQKQKTASTQAMNPFQAKLMELKKKFND